MIPGLGRSPGEGKGYPHQYSGLESSMDYICHGVAKGRTQLSDFHLCKKKMGEALLVQRISLEVFMRNSTGCPWGEELVPGKQG